MRNAASLGISYECLDRLDIRCIDLSGINLILN